MPIVTATEVTILSNISASAVTIINSEWISEVTQAVNLATNNYFTTELYVQNTMTFNPSVLTIISGDDFESFGFANGDEIFVCGSYRNDGYHQVRTVSGNTLILATGATIYSELSGAPIFIAVVIFPKSLKRVAAQMVAYNCDKRNKQSSGLKSRSLGPLSETFSGADKKGEGNGYPSEIMDMLIPFRVARVI